MGEGYECPVCQGEFRSGYCPTSCSEAPPFAGNQKIIPEKGMDPNMEMKPGEMPILGFLLDPRID